MTRTPNPNNANDRFVILLDGPVTAAPRLIDQLAGRRVVAADGGMRHASALDLEPEIWVGDFDSASEALQRDNADVEREAFPAAKAQSDGALAIERAVALGAKDIVVCGATGGPRSDHVLFNLGLLVWARQEFGCDAWAANGTEEHHLLAGPCSTPFNFATGTIFSVVPLGLVRGLTISGAQWPLQFVTVDFGTTLTLSNRVQAPLRVNLESGMVFVVAQMDHD